MSPHAHVPVKGTEHSAGFDLFSAEEKTVPGNGKALIKTDLKIRVPFGCYGRIAPRSGLTVKHFIDVGAGVIDADYRGNVKVVLFNFSNENFLIKIGDPIAQLICEKIEIPILEECENLDETQRGGKGFGSTILNN